MGRTRINSNLSTILEQVRLVPILLLKFLLVTSNFDGWADYEDNVDFQVKSDGTVITSGTVTAASSLEMVLVN